MNNRERIDYLASHRRLPRAEWAALFASWGEEDRAHAAALAREVTRARFGNRVYFRGIVEFSNICRNDCFYCGIRRSNGNAARYRLTQEEIMLCCREGYRLGYRTFVLQSGEDGYWDDEKMVALIKAIKAAHPDCAVTLSIGERERASYEALYRAGADRYLLRHETADKAHYALLHPAAMSFEHRINCLRELKEIGYQVGAGMMIGTPHQTPDTLAQDMLLMEEIQPAMAGIGPFLPHKDTPFHAEKAGDKALTLLCLSLTRLMLPDVLMPATTALGTLDEDGRVEGVQAGCNVVMPNLSPKNVRKDYMLYDNKAGTELSAEESLNLLRAQMLSIGREIVVGRGDHRDYERKDNHHA